MEETGRDVDEVIAAVTPSVRRRDAQTLVDLMGEITGLVPASWSGGIVGFGSHHYVYGSGREGEVPVLGFAPRKAASTIYLVDGVGPHEADLADLGPHTTGVGCLYLKDLEKVDMTVLRRILTESYRTMA
jgi:hypothetical protein